MEVEVWRGAPLSFWIFTYESLLAFQHEFIASRLFWRIVCNLTPPRRSEWWAWMCPKWSQTLFNLIFLSFPLFTLTISSPFDVVKFIASLGVLLLLSEVLVDVGMEAKVEGLGLKMKCSLLVFVYDLFKVKVVKDEKLERDVEWNFLLRTLFYTLYDETITS